MKATFKYGIKSFSGTIDDLNFANYRSRGITIARQVPVSRRITDQNIVMGESMKRISAVYNATSEYFKKELTYYTLRLYNTKEYQEGLAGNRFSTFVKMIWNASKDLEKPLDISSLSVDDLEIGAYEQIGSVKVAVENGFLPKVNNYEIFDSSII